MFFFAFAKVYPVPFRHLCWAYPSIQLTEKKGVQKTAGAVQYDATAMEVVGLRYSKYPLGAKQSAKRIRWLTTEVVAAIKCDNEHSLNAALFMCLDRGGAVVIPYIAAIV